MFDVGPLSAAAARIPRAGPRRAVLPLADLTGRFVQSDRNAVYKKGPVLISRGSWRRSRVPQPPNGRPERSPIRFATPYLEVEPWWIPSQQPTITREPARASPTSNGGQRNGDDGPG